MELFSTRGLPSAQKVSYWNDLACESFAQMEIQPHDAGRFDGTLRRERLGPVTVIDVFSAAAHIRHTRAHVARTSAPSYVLLTPLRREFELVLDHSRRVRVGAGEFCLIDQARPYELLHGDAVRTLCLAVPRESFEMQIPGATQLVGRLIRSNNAMARMLVGLLQNLGDETGPSGITRLPAAIGPSLLSFVIATYSTVIEAPMGRGVKARAMAYRVYIDSRLTDSELKPADVASHFGVSERYLRAVLRADGESFSTYLLRRRLMRCAHRLADRDWARSTITEIAFESGFGGATHFGQAFKLHYGVTPREYRHRNAIKQINGPPVAPIKRQRSVEQRHPLKP